MQIEKEMSTLSKASSKAQLTQVANDRDHRFPIFLIKWEMEFGPISFYTHSPKMKDTMHVNVENNNTIFCIYQLLC